MSGTQRWALALVGLVVTIVGMTVAFTAFHSNGSTAGLFGGCGVAGFGVIALFAAKDGAW